MQWFPLWAGGLALHAFQFPGWWLGGKHLIVPLLAMVMFCMGLTLTWTDFRRVLGQPGVILLGVGLQFLVMPAAALAIGHALKLSPDHLAGLVLVGSSAGGTASNVICYLARGHVALSVLMTLTSTLLAIVATPALTYLYLHHRVPVPAATMCMSILQMVLGPVLAGVLLNSWLGGCLGRIRPLLPLLAGLAIAVIIGVIVALNHASIATTGRVVLIAVGLHNLCGLACGYWVPAWLGFDATTRRTLAIEVGMQNSGLSVALAVKYFSAAAALPGALFSLWHNLSGALLAAWWRRRA